MMTDPQYPSTPPRHGRQAGAPDTASGPGTAPHRRASTTPGANLLAVVGLAFGLAGLVVTFLPGVGVVAWPLAGIGLVLAIVGLLQTKKGAVSGRGLAIAGIAVSGAALLVTAALFLYNTFFNGGSDGLHLPAVSGDKHTVTFTVTAAGGANVRYGTLNDQRTDTATASTDAWTQKASYNNGSYSLTVTADTTNSNVNNQISCSITLDGQKVAENSGTTIALCTTNIG